MLPLNSCNYKLLVNRKRIVSDERGYLTFFKDEVVFFPWPDSIDVAFLSKSHEHGFKVNEKGIDWLDSIAARYTIQVSKGMPTAQLPDTIAVIPVNMQYYLGDFWDSNSEKNAIYYYWEGTRYVLTYKLYDYRHILRITAIRKRDIERAIYFYNPSE